MGFTRKSIIAAPDSVATTANIPVEKGILTCVRFSDSLLSATGASAYGIISLASSETPEPVPFCTLASGYFGGDAEIGWNGLIRVSPTFTVIGTIFGVQLRPYDLSIYLDLE